jgi:hypothetical protein
MKLFMKRKVSTQRVDDMASNQAVAALDRRVNTMLMRSATNPIPQPRHFEALSNPIQKPSNS